MTTYPAPHVAIDNEDERIQTMTYYADDLAGWYPLPLEYTGVEVLVAGGQLVRIDVQAAYQGRVGVPADRDTARYHALIEERYGVKIAPLRPSAWALAKDRRLPFLTQAIVVLRDDPS